jgi:hypothetical protein
VVDGSDPPITETDELVCYGVELISLPPGPDMAVIRIIEPNLETNLTSTSRRRLIALPLRRSAMDAAPRPSGPPDEEESHLFRNRGAHPPDP